MRASSSSWTGLHVFEFTYKIHRQRTYQVSRYLYLSSYLNLSKYRAVFLKSQIQNENIHSNASAVPNFRSIMARKQPIPLPSYSFRLRGATSSFRGVLRGVRSFVDRGVAQHNFFTKMRDRVIFSETNVPMTRNKIIFFWTTNKNGHLPLENALYKIPPNYVEFSPK